MLRVSVSVFWTDMRGVAPAKSSTILSPPVGSYDPNNGHIAVKVLGSTADPLAGVPVTVTGTQLQPQPHHHVGRLRVLRVRPAGRTYTVALGAVGYVDRQGERRPVAGHRSHLRARRARSRSTTTRRRRSRSRSARPGGGLVPVEPRRSRSGNTALLPTGSKAFAGTGAIRTVGNLFPYADGLHRVGRELCGRRSGGRGRQRARVLGRRDAAGTELQTSPGGTASGTVDLPTFELRYGDISVVEPARSDIVAVHDADNGCPTGLQYTIGTFSGPGELADGAAVRHVDVHGPGRDAARRDLADGHARPA